MKTSSFLAAIALLSSLAGRPVYAADSVPLAYDVPADLAVRPKPPLPDPGSPGTVIADPTYGSRILRVTGPLTDSRMPNAAFYGPAEAFAHNWNANGTLFWVYGAGGVIPFRFNPAKMTAAPFPGRALDLAGPFSYRKSNIMYGRKGLQIFEYDFNTGRRTLVFDAAKAVPTAAAVASMPSVSDDDSKLCLAFSGEPGSYQYVAVLDRKTGAYTVLDAANSQLNAQPASTRLGFKIETAYIDRTGRYVTVKNGQGEAGSPPEVVWDLSNAYVAEVRNSVDGVSAPGFGVGVNEGGYSGKFHEPIDYVIRSLDPTRASSTTLLIDPDQTPTPHLPIETGHFSWNNAQSQTRVPIAGSHYRKKQDASQPWRAWDDEIIAVATDGSSKVWRFAHHRSLYDGSNSWDAPNGSVSQDGRWYLFTSNWERTLGDDPSGHPRQDVFLVELRPGTPGQPSPKPPTSRPPTPGDTQSTPPPPSPSSGGSSRLTYASPYCGPKGGSTPWACGAWPSKMPPSLGPAGSIVTDPDTHNRVLRVTGPGSFGEAAGTAFKGFDGGWRQLWNANSSRLLIESWSGGSVKHQLNWVNFNGSSMSTSGGTPVPYQFKDVEWDRSNPDLLVGISDDKAKSYNVVTKAWSEFFDPAVTKWGGKPWLSAWGDASVCIAEGPQDTGHRLACFDRNTHATRSINLHTQTINGKKFPVLYKGKEMTLPQSVTMHSIMMAPDGKWIAIDTHGNSSCSVPGLPGYAIASLMIDLEKNVAYQWSVACGGTHWAYGFDSVMMQSASPRWTSTGADGPCNSDSRGVGRRRTDSGVDTSYASLAPCRFFDPATWNVSVHLSWTNNANDANANKYPVIMGTTNEGVPDSFLWGEIAAMETGTSPYQARLWRFAQTWNDRAPEQCDFVSYSSPSVSRDGKWALFVSDWRGKTGKGVCTKGKRTDMFIFELK